MLTRQRLSAVALVAATVLLLAGWAFAIRHVGRSSDPVASAPDIGADVPASPTATAVVSPARDASVYLLGDDLLAAAVRGPDRSIASIALLRLGRRGIVSGQAGSGFLPGLDPTAQTYAYRLARDVAGKPVRLLVLVAGSGDRDDAPQALATAAQLTFAAARQAAPQARTVVVGPLGSPQPDVAAAMAREREVLRAAVATAGPEVTFFDPIERGWVSAAAPGSFRGDGLNVTPVGDVYFGKRLAEALDPLVRQSAPEAARR